VHLASENVLRILLTSQTADLMEAIDFIASAQQFGLLSEEESILKLLEFLHSKDLTLKKAVSEACKRIYLSSIDSSVNHQINQYVLQSKIKLWIKKALFFQCIFAAMTTSKR
jgi:hypothetical protein